MLTKLAAVAAEEMSVFDVVTSRQIMLSPFISRMWTWWVRRSSSAPVRRSDPKTAVHSSKGRVGVSRSPAMASPSPGNVWRGAAAVKWSSSWAAGDGPENNHPYRMNTRL